MNKGVIVLPSGKTVLHLLPPLVISYEELDVVVERLRSNASQNILYRGILVNRFFIYS